MTCEGNVCVDFSNSYHVGFSARARIERRTIDAPRDMNSMKTPRLRRRDAAGRMVYCLPEFDNHQATCVLPKSKTTADNTTGEGWEFVKRFFC